MSFWLPSRAPWSLDPGLRREDDERDQRQLRALSFPLRKQGPRSRSGAAATGRTSAQQAFRRHSAGAHEKKAPSVLQKPWWLNVLLVAAQCSVVPGSRPRLFCRGGKTRGRKAGATMVRLRGVDLSAAGLRLALGSFWVPAFSGKTLGECCDRPASLSPTPSTPGSGRRGRRPLRRR